MYNQESHPEPCVYQAGILVDTGNQVRHRWNPIVYSALQSLTKLAWWCRCKIIIIHYDEMPYTTLHDLLFLCPELFLCRVPVDGSASSCFSLASPLFFLHWEGSLSSSSPAKNLEKSIIFTFHWGGHTARSTFVVLLSRRAGGWCGKIFQGANRFSFEEKRFISRYLAWSSQCRPQSLSL